MEEVVQGETRVTTASNGQIQSGSLFRKVRVVVKCGAFKRIITLSDVMYIPEAPCNLVSEGKFRNKGLYLDAQKDIIHDGNEVVANCPILICANVRILETHPDHDTIDRKVGYSLVATKTISSSFELWHQRLLHAGDRKSTRLNSSHI